MKTDDLIESMARALRPAPPRAGWAGYALALGAGVIGALLLTRYALGSTALLATDPREPMLWVKFAFGSALAMTGLLAVARLGRPGMALRWTGAAPVVPVLLVWVLGIAALALAPLSEWRGLVFGQTWSRCPGSIALLSLPALAALLTALRAMAPTRPLAAGAAAGAVAGGVAAAIYALICPELAAPFVAVWYVLGVLIAVAIGVTAGHFALRW